ncbi:hypothetical protein ABG067_001012 [Albugo candida]
MELDLSKFSEFNHQVGGHTASKTSLKAHDGILLKPFQDKDRGVREKSFYELVFSDKLSGKHSTIDEKHHSSDVTSLQPFLPCYYGSIHVPDPASISHDDNTTTGDDAKKISKLRESVAPSKKEGSILGFLVLEDLTWKFDKPCVMDVKLGTKSYEATACSEKVAYEKSKFPLQEEMGFRIQGIKVYDPSACRYIEYDKYFGRLPTSKEDVSRTFAHYFQFLSQTRRKQVIREFIVRLEQLKSWFETQHDFEFIASSLLFMHDQETKALPKSHVDLRIIDFAHVQTLTTVYKKRDVGVLRGIVTIIDCLTNILESEHIFDNL